VRKAVHSEAIAAPHTAPMLPMLSSACDISCCCCCRCCCPHTNSWRAGLLLLLLLPQLASFHFLGAAAQQPLTCYSC
jgi:hypothetical protein